ncbi:MAG TPA: hypothetical protein PLK77_15575, partial [Pyrinomonadaceae bacterium]|nr:hypothetical protein [Pyrinomonadaceae bacterium]
EEGKGGRQIVAEEMLLWGWRGAPSQKEYLEHSEAKDLLKDVTASSDMSPQQRTSFLENELTVLPEPDSEEFLSLAEEQSKKLVAAHERFSSLMDRSKFQVVYPVLPMDLLGIYVLLPEVAG